MSVLYNDWLDKDLLLKHYSDLKPEISQSNMLKIIKKVNKKKMNVNVLDFGAGYGNFCVLSSELGFNTYAFDLSNDKNSHLASKLGVQIINELENFRSFFDFIFINHVLEHISNPVVVLRKIQNCLNPGGIIFVSVPDCKDICETINNRGLSEELFHQISTLQHINAFNNKTLVLLGRESGLKKLNIIDFIKLFNLSLAMTEVKYLLKAIIKTSTGIGTNLFFHKIK